MKGDNNQGYLSVKIRAVGPSELASAWAVVAFDEIMVICRAPTQIYSVPGIKMTISNSENPAKPSSCTQDLNTRPRSSIHGTSKARPLEYSYLGTAYTPAKMTDLKQALIDSGEDWSPEWDKVNELTPEYLAAYIKLRKVPIEKQKLSRKVQELLLLAMDAQCTHLYPAGIAAHTSAALKAGASVGEIIETLELSSVLGVHAVTVGVPLLVEVMTEKGIKLNQDLDERQQKLKADFQRQRGYWSTSWDPVIRLSPEFFEAYTNYSSVPFQPGHSHLDAKTKEFVYCAIDCATTHLFAPGLKIHIQNAIDKGASPEEVMEVFELAALMGSQTVLAGAEALKNAQA